MVRHLKIGGMDCTLCKFPFTRCHGYVLSLENTILCILCQKRVEYALNSLPGTEAHVDLISGIATITSPDTLTDEELFQAVSSEGFTAKRLD